MTDVRVPSSNLVVDISTDVEIGEMNGIDGKLREENRSCIGRKPRSIGIGLC